jgi:Uncharacterised protein family UPF0102
LGVRGEDLACAELVRQEMRVLERNWRCRLGEIDVVAAETGKTYAEIWEESSICERRELLRSWIGPSGLTIGKGKPGIRGFQPARVLDIAKLNDVPADFALNYDDLVMVDGTLIEVAEEVMNAETK